MTRYYIQWFEGKVTVVELKGDIIIGDKFSSDSHRVIFNNDPGISIEDSSNERHVWEGVVDEKTLIIYIFGVNI